MKIYDLDTYYRHLAEKYGLALTTQNHDETADSVSSGWKGVGIFWGIASSSAVIALLPRFGLDPFMLRSKSGVEVGLELFVLLAGLLNVYSWFTNPPIDLRVLRTWLKTASDTFDADGTERLMIFGQILLATLVCMASFVHPVWIGLLGVICYSVNYHGYNLILARVERGVAQAREFNATHAPPDALPHLEAATNCISTWWGCGRRGYRNPMQKRHINLILAFSSVLIVGLLYLFSRDKLLEFGSLLFAGLTFIYAVGSITRYRSRRDLQLKNITSGWRARAFE